MQKSNTTDCLQNVFSKRILQLFDNFRAEAVFLINSAGEPTFGANRLSKTGNTSFVPVRQLTPQALGKHKPFGFDIFIKTTECNDLHRWSFFCLKV